MAFRLKLAPAEPKIDFLGRRKVAALGSAALIILSFVFLLVLQLNFGIDFRGGTLVEARFQQDADLGAIRRRLSDLDLGDITVQEFGRPDTVQMRVEGQSSGDAQQNAAETVAVALQQTFPGVSIRRTEVVGPKVSGELIQKGVIAVVLAVGLVLVYIWLRFEWQFSVGAVAALLHDVALTIGVFSLLQIEFTLAIVAAILTIVGYSLNDTVVVFDRVRENLRRYKTTPLADVLNMSINETLSRTLMTSVTTLLALFSLYLLGGPALAGFSFAMIWGVVVGTYSSVFIASPILLWLQAKAPSDDAADSGAGVQFR